MENKYLSIGVKDSSIEEVNHAIKSLELEDFILQGINNSEIFLEVIDYTNEYTYASTFLSEKGLQDNTPFFNVFDMNLFGLTVELNVKTQFKNTEMLEPLVFIVGQKLSSILKTECLVLFENGTIPIGLFNNGKLTELFEEFNSELFKKRLWKPVIA